MQRVFAMLTLAALLTPTQRLHAQLTILKNDGWGSLSGKITLIGPVPEIVDLAPKMKAHADAACCLAKDTKAAEKLDTIWVVDPKTKAVANVIVWIKAPKDSYFPLPSNYKAKKEPLVIDQPHCAFVPRIAAYNPVNIIDGKPVATGQKVEFKNSAVVPHNTRATGSPMFPGNSFNINIPPKGELTREFEPQKLPINLQCDVHTWMGAKLAVFDHPYFAITKEDGSFEIPNVPAGATVALVAWHEGVGYVLPELSKGREMNLKQGKNVVDLQFKAP